MPMGMKTTIEQKIIPAIVIVVSLILGALGTYTYLSSKADLLNDAHQTMDEAVSRLSITLVSPLWDINKDSAQEFVAAEMTSNAVMRIVVHDTKNVLFAGKTRDASGEMVDQVVSVERQDADKIRKATSSKTARKSARSSCILPINSSLAICTHH